MRPTVSRSASTLVALAAGGITLVILAVFDNTVMRDVQEQARTGDPSQLAMMTVLEALLVAGSVMLLGVLAWRSASAVVGLVYVVVGGFFGAQLWIWWNFAAAGTDALPEAVAAVLRNLFYWSAGGALNDIATIGAGMLIAGLATLARWWRIRAVAAGSVMVGTPTPGPKLP
jgi:hypothetical protein